VSFEGDRVFIRGQDVTEEIRQPRIDRVVSSVARHRDVREVMRERQRELGSEGDAVIEGRDIGTVVCPNADVKVYLVADAVERARRRTADRPEIGKEALATDLRLRDERDAAQMQPAADAQEIDTTELSIDEVVDRIEQLVLARSGA
jgi:cytidylate kinase